MRPAWPGPSLWKADGGWCGLSSLTLWLKGAWQPHVAMMTLLPPSVPSHSCGRCFWQQGSGKLLLDPERVCCLAQPGDLASPRPWVRALAGLTCTCSVGRQLHPMLWEGPSAWGQASGQHLRRCSLSGLCEFLLKFCTLAPHLPPSHSCPIKQAWICDFAV